MSRFTFDGLPQDDSSPVALVYQDKSVPFAAANNPRWIPFYRRIELTHGAYGQTSKITEDMPTHIRSMFVKVALEELGKLEGEELSCAAAGYLKTINGKIEWLTEGVWIANNDYEREYIKKRFNDMTLPQVRELLIRSPDGTEQYLFRDSLP